MLIRLRSILNKINQVLLFVYLFDFFIEDEEFSQFINLAFITSILIESLFLLSDKSKQKSGDLIFPKTLMDQHSSKIRNLMFILSIGAIIYYLLFDDIAQSEVITNIILPLYFGFFFKELFGVRFGKDFIQINGLNSRIIDIVKLDSIEVKRTEFILKSSNKTYSAKGLHPEAIIEIQDFLFSQKIDHIKLIV